MYVEFFGDKMKTNNRLAYLNLDCDNGVHMFLLHYVYTPRINNAIESFCESWNHHPLEPLLVQVQDLSSSLSVEAYERLNQGRLKLR